MAHSHLPILFSWPNYVPEPPQSEEGANNEVGAEMGE